MTPVQALQNQLALRPDEVAFIARGEAWSYRRLAHDAERLARALATRGVRRGDRVALHMFNLPELAVAYYACFRLGAIAAPLNTRSKAAELRPLLERLRPAAYLGEARLYAPIADIEPAILAADARFVVGGGVDARARPWAALIDAARDDDAAIPCVTDNAAAVLLATSGTTGTSKLVTHTPATLSAAIEACRPLGFGDSQIAINALPMVHSGGFMTLLACIRYGAPMVMVECFDADAVLDAIETHRCSWMLGLPFMFVEMMRRQRGQPRQVGTLRFCLSGGDVCPAELQQAFPGVFGVPLHSVWAATEVVGSLIHGLEPGAVSRIAPGTQFRLANDNGAPVAAGEVGELLVRGPNVAVGYWLGPDRIDGVGHDGWYHTGDLMRRGQANDLWFVARKKDLIVRGGSNISPVEVERVLTAHPEVRDAAVVGVPDAALGQRVAALVALAGKPGGAVLDDILASARAQLADYKLPERLKVVDAIPRNALGKVERKALLALLSDNAGTTAPHRPSAIPEGAAVPRRAGLDASS